MLSFGRSASASVSVKKKALKESKCTLYRVLNGSPSQNMEKLVSLIGGMEKIIGPYDVVIIKPNVQWWNQGAPNLAALKTFVDIIMSHKDGFNGEVVIAENCHRGSEPWNHAGWAHPFKWNSDLTGVSSMSDLARTLKHTYGNRYSTCHWIDVDEGARRVFNPQDGTGYVYCDGTGGVPNISYDNGLQGNNRRSVIMTYPIFKTDKGTVVDLKNGVWEKDKYTGQPVKFINFSALNHHSTYCGATSAVKNYLGISDLSGGADPFNGGKLTETSYNFHSFPFNEWTAGPKPGMIGGEIACFMNKIRKADLNITTAEWVGLASRTDPPMVKTKAVFACIDPVALDYHSAKYLLYPNSKIAFHNPDNPESPLNQYLVKCSEEDGGLFDESFVDVKSFDINSNSLQQDKDLVVAGDKVWGSDAKTIVKYLFFRYFYWG